MKRALEAAVLAAALAIGLYIVHAWAGRRPAPPRPPGVPPSAAGPDVENPDAPASRVPPRRGVVELPMVKLSRPPKAQRASAAVPPPSSAP